VTSVLLIDSEKKTYTGKFRGAKNQNFLNQMLSYQLEKV